MTPFDSCLAALKQPGPPETLFKAVDKALGRTQPAPPRPALRKAV